MNSTVQCRRGFLKRVVRKNSGIILTHNEVDSMFFTENFKTRLVLISKNACGIFLNIETSIDKNCS